MEVLILFSGLYSLYIAMYSIAGYLDFKQVQKLRDSKH